MATTGNLTPFIGLLGTVLGIINAFGEIGVQGSASIAAVAPGVSEALVATAAGLFAAIPAVMAYNFFSIQNSEKWPFVSKPFTIEFLNTLEESEQAAYEVEVAQMTPGAKPRQFLSEINVIPLVDVVLVLLVIFMVTAPMLHQRIGY